jgi:membrane protein DedA with SNARE-associated domain
LLAALEQFVIPFIEHLYAQVGYLGVLFAMAIESACIPLPSEIIMPMAGWMVYRGVFDIWVVAVVGTLGNTLGSSAAYWVGYLGGRPLIEKYGRYILITIHDLEVADRWFGKYGQAAVFFGRLLPVVRTFISFPAGVSRMPYGKFLLYSTLGAFPWVLALAYAGKLMGDNWVVVREILKNFDYPIAAVIVAAVAYYIYRHTRPSKPSAVRRESQNAAD